MDSMKSFTTAAKQATEQGTDIEGVLTFDIDGHPVTAFRPDDGQLAVLMAETSRYAKTTQMVAGAINFFQSTLDENSQAYIQERLLDRKDAFGLEEVQDILSWMIKEWTGLDFESPSGSTPSPRAGGQKSKRPTPAST